MVFNFYLQNESLLHHFILLKKPDQVASLLENGADVSAKQSNNPLSPLHLAVKLKQNESVRLLLESNAEPDITDQKSGSTPLLFAIAYGNNEAVSMLLEHGANPSHKNIKNETPLLYALNNKNTYALSLLLARGVDFDPNDRQLVFFVVRLQCPECLLMMIQAGINLNIKNSKGETLIEAAKRYPNPASELLLTSNPLPETADPISFLDFLNDQIAKETQQAINDIKKKLATPEQVQLIDRRIRRFDQYLQSEARDLSEKLRNLESELPGQHDDYMEKIIQLWRRQIKSTRECQQMLENTLFTKEASATLNKWKGVIESRINQIEKILSCNIQQKNEKGEQENMKEQLWQILEKIKSIVSDRMDQAQQFKKISKRYLDSFNSSKEENNEMKSEGAEPDTPVPRKIIKKVPAKRRYTRV